METSRIMSINSIYLTNNNKEHGTILRRMLTMVGVRLG